MTLILSHRTICSRTYSFAQSHLFTKFAGGQHSVLEGEGELKIVLLERTDEGFSSENNMRHSNNMRPENCCIRKCTNFPNVRVYCVENLFCVKLAKLELCFQNFHPGMWPCMGHNPFTF